jgi:hypothetical protein
MIVETRSTGLEVRETRLGRETNAPALSVASPHLLHRLMPYSPDELVPLVRQTAESSPVWRELILREQLTAQLKGEIAEACTRHAFSSIGEMQKLVVDRESGAHTADFRVILKTDVRVGANTFRAGQVLIVEVKHGSPEYCLQQLRTSDSHARKQLASSVERERADGAVCLIPRECQNYRALFEVVRDDILAHEGAKTSVMMVLPHEGALQKALVPER